jgi:hypothetical protein
MTDTNGAYHHTQAGFFILGLYAIGMVIMALGYRSISHASPPGPVRSSILGLLAVVAVGVTIVSFLFSSLTIDVRDGTVRWHFTGNVIRGSIAIRDIERVYRARSSAAYGWGLRKTPEGTIYLVSGLDVVRIRKSDGTQIGFGTDEPARLARSIEEAMADRR